MQMHVSMRYEFSSRNLHSPNEKLAMKPIAMPICMVLLIDMSDIVIQERVDIRKHYVLGWLKIFSVVPKDRRVELRQKEER
jgi:hypothetical protein